MQDACVHVCNHLDALSAVRFAATCKCIHAAVKDSVDNRTDLLPMRVVMSTVRDLQAHLLSEYQLHTVQQFDITYSKNFPGCKYFGVSLDSDARRGVVMTGFALDTPDLTVSMLLPWRKNHFPLRDPEQYQSFSICPSTDTAGVVDHASYENGLFKALLETHIVWTPTSPFRSDAEIDLEIARNDAHAYDDEYFHLNDNEYFHLSLGDFDHDI